MDRSYQFHGQTVKYHLKLDRLFLLSYERWSFLFKIWHFLLYGPKYEIQCGINISRNRKINFHFITCFELSFRWFAPTTHFDYLFRILNNVNNMCAWSTVHKQPFQSSQWVRAQNLSTIIESPLIGKNNLLEQSDVLFKIAFFTVWNLWKWDFIVFYKS